MKVLQLAALFGRAVSAVQPLAAPRVHRALSDVTTTVVLTTSTYTVTKCATDATNCPGSATVVLTSTTAVTVTTTICSLTSTPGAQAPASEVSPTSVAGPALLSGSVAVSASIVPPTPTAHIPVPIGSSSSAWVSVSNVDSILLPLTTNMLSEAVPTSFPSGGASSSTGYAPPPPSALPTFSLSGTGINSISSPGSGVPVSSVFVTASLPGKPTSIVTDSTATDAVSVSGGTSSSGYNAPSTSGVIPLVPSLTNTDSIPTSFPVSSVGPSSVTASSGGYATPPGSLASPSNTNTDSIPTSFPVSSVGASSFAASSGGYVTPPGSLASPSNTNTDSIPTSFPVSASGTSSVVPSLSGPVVPSGSSVVHTGTASVVSPTPASSSGPIATTAAPTQITSSATHGPSYGASPTTLPGALSTVSGPQPAITSLSSGYAAPPMPTGSDTSDIDSTVRITSYLTWTSFITVQPPSSHSSIDTNTQAVPTSIPSGVSALPSSYPTLNPSGSGYAWPSGTGNGTIVSPTGTGNGTIVSPKPTYSDIPINMGRVVGAGKSSLAAFVVALAFAHLA